MFLRRYARITAVAFVIYIVLLCWLILFKLALNPGEIPHMRSLNLIPFIGSVIINDRLYVWEIFMNMLCFVPLGLGVSIYAVDEPFRKKVLICLGVSLMFEVLQFVFAIGASDITDLLANTLGGAIGIGLYYLLENMFGRRAQLVVAVSGIVLEIIFVVFYIFAVIMNI